MIKNIFFDLDGTLLPMDQDLFVKYYFSMLAKKISPLGYDSEQLINGIWYGTKQMITNDGSMSNEDRFWSCAKTIFGDKIIEDKHHFEDFYKNEFQIAQKACGFNPKSKEIIEFVKEKQFRIFLATNPIFPSIATYSRIKWAGLKPDDFEWITTYENATYSKPNLKYYQEILDRFDLKKEECLMIGNDVNEDMVTRQLGFKVFLLTDNLINTDRVNIEQFPHGNFDDLKEFLMHIN